MDPCQLLRACVVLHCQESISVSSSLPADIYGNLRILLWSSIMDPCRSLLRPPDPATWALCRLALCHKRAIIQATKNPLVFLSTQDSWKQMLFLSCLPCPSSFHDPTTLDLGDTQKLHSSIPPKSQPRNRGLGRDRSHLIRDF